MAERKVLVPKDKVEELRHALDKLNELRPVIDGVFWILDDIRNQYGQEEFEESITQAMEKA